MSKKNKEILLTIKDDSIKKQNISQEYIDIPYCAMMVLVTFFIVAGFVSIVEKAFELDVNTSLHLGAIFCYSIIMIIIMILVNDPKKRKLIGVALIILPGIFLFKTIITGVLDCVDGIMQSMNLQMIIDRDIIEEYIELENMSDAQEYFWLYIILLITVFMMRKLLKAEVPYFIINIMLAAVIASLIFGGENSFFWVAVFFSFTLGFMFLKNQSIMKGVTGYVTVAIMAVIMISATLVSKAIIGNDHEKPEIVAIIQDKISSIEVGGIFSSLASEKRGQLSDEGPENTGEIMFILTMEEFEEPIYLKSYTANSYSLSGWSDSEYKYGKDENEELRLSLGDADFKTQGMQSEFLQLIKNNKNYMTYLGESNPNSFSKAYRETTMTVKKVSEDEDYIIYPYDVNFDNFTFYTDMQPYAPDLESYTLDRITYKPDSKFDGSIGTYLEAIDSLYKTQEMEAYYNYYKCEKLYRNFAHEEYTKLPSYTLKDMQKEYSKYKIENYEDVEKLTKQIQNYFVTNYTYSLKPGKAPWGSNQLEYFFYESKQGYCVYFATAATLMFRAAGVPARYVEGYIVLPNDIGQYSESYMKDMEIDGCNNAHSKYDLYEVVVTDKMAHAWVEIYIDGYGWMPVEVTPSTTNDGSLYTNVQVQEPTTEEPTTEEPTTEEPTTEEPTTKEPTTKEPTTKEPTTEEPTTEEPSTEEPTSGEDKGNSGDGDDGGEDGGNKPSKVLKKSRIELYVILVLTLIGAGLCILAIRHGYYTYKRKKMLAETIANVSCETVFELYDYMERMLKYIGFERESSSTYSVYKSYLNNECPYANVVDFNYVIDVAVYAKFSQSVEKLDVAGLATVKENIVKLRTAVYTDLSWHKKIVFQFILNL